jgi:hypothetical protein
VVCEGCLGQQRHPRLSARTSRTGPRTRLGAGPRPWSGGHRRVFSASPVSGSPEVRAHVLGLRRKSFRKLDAKSSAKSMIRGGEGGIRTPDTVARMPHFECGAIDHSATSPWPGRRGKAPVGRAGVYPRRRGETRVGRGAWFTAPGERPEVTGSPLTRGRQRRIGPREAQLGGLVSLRLRRARANGRMPTRKHSTPLVATISTIGRGVPSAIQP